MTYGYCKKIIASGRYDKNSMKDKLDVFLLAERITDDEYKELVAKNWWQKSIRMRRAK